MEAIKRQIKFQVIDTKNAFITFWSIIILVNLFLYVINGIADFGSAGVSFSASFNGSQEEFISVASVHVISIIIFIIVSSMVMYYETFPIAIGFSTTRKDFYIGVVVHNIILSLSMAIIQGGLMKLDGFIIEAIGRNPLYEQLMFNTKEDSLLYIILMLFIIFLFCTSLFNLLGAALYRFTWKLWLVIGGITMLASNIDVLVNPLRSLLPFELVIEHSRLVWLSDMLIISVILYIIAFFLIRKISIRSRG